MENNKLKTVRRNRRKRGIRKRIFGTAEKPRLSVFRSVKNIYAQLIDDELGVTVCEASTMGKDVRDQVKGGGNVAAAKVVGKILAERARDKNVSAVQFDRNGFRYHGRLKELADAAREGGLQF